jgi:hypothetical protein
VNELRSLTDCHIVVTYDLQVPGGVCAVVESVADAAPPASCATLFGVHLHPDAAVAVVMAVVGEHLDAAAVTWSIGRSCRVVGDDTRVLITGSGGRLLLDSRDADHATADLASTVLLVRQSEVVGIRVGTSDALPIADGNSTPVIDSVTIGGSGARATWTQQDDRNISLIDPLSAVHVVRGRDIAGQPFLFQLSLLVDEVCPAARVDAGGRLRIGPAPVNLLPVEVLTAEVTWPYARGTVSAVHASNGHRSLPLPCSGAALGVGSHDVILTTELQGCVSTSVRVCVVVDALLAAPRVDVVYALLTEPGGAMATTRRRALAAGTRRFFASNTRVEVYIDGDADGAALAMVDATSGEVLWRTKELRHGWADASGVLHVLHTRRPATCSILVLASAPGCRDGVAGPFHVTVGHKCAAPRLNSMATLPKVYALSGTTIAVLLPDGGGDEPSARGQLTLTSRSSGGDDQQQFFAQPDACGIAQVTDTLWFVESVLTRRAGANYDSIAWRGHRHSAPAARVCALGATRGDLHYRRDARAAGRDCVACRRQRWPRAGAVGREHHSRALIGGARSRTARGRAGSGGAPSH